MQLQTPWDHILTKVEQVILMFTSFGHYAVLWSIFGLHMSRVFLPDKRYFSANFLLNYLLCFTKEYPIGCFWEYTWCVLCEERKRIKKSCEAMFVHIHILLTTHLHLMGSRRLSNAVVLVFVASKSEPVIWKAFERTVGFMLTWFAWLQPGRAIFSFDELLENLASIMLVVRLRWNNLKIEERETARWMERDCHGSWTLMDGDAVIYLNCSCLGGEDLSER